MNEKFAVGQPVSRKEDPVLQGGEGRYTDDLNCPGQLYGGMVRSRMAHGDLRSIDTDAAREMPGVHMIVTATDLDAAGIKNMSAAVGKHRDGTPTPRPPQRPLATDHVRYERRSVVAGFDGGNLTSNAGALPRQHLPSPLVRNRVLQCRRQCLPRFLGLRRPNLIFQPSNRSLQ